MVDDLSSENEQLKEQYEDQKVGSALTRITHIRLDVLNCWMNSAAKSRT
jgi:hypothetical protein